MLKLLMKKLGTPPIEPDSDGGNAGVRPPGARASAWTSAAPELFEWLAEPGCDCDDPDDWGVGLPLGEAVSLLVGCERCRTASGEGEGEGLVVVCVVVTASDGTPASEGPGVSGAAGVVVDVGIV